MNVGDRARILDDKSYYGGWASEMNAYVGKTYIIRALSEHGVLLKGNIFTWDVRYLELVEEKKMENKITIDGKEYTLSAELVEKIKAEVVEQEKAKNPFERKTNERYYYVDSSGRIYSFVDNEGATAKTLYAVGNYCRDKELMEQRALHETLNRLLWRYSEMHGGGEKRGGFFIYLSGMEDMRVGHCTYAGCGDVYFRKKETAEAAIEEVVKPFMAAHPEFVW